MVIHKYINKLVNSFEKHVRVFLKTRTTFFLKDVHGFFKTLTAHHETQNFPLKTFRKANNNVYYTLYLRSKRLFEHFGYEKKV